MSAARACAAPKGYVVADAAVPAEQTRLVVMLPESGPATGYRVFYGTPEHLTERSLANFAMASTQSMFWFDVEGTPYTAIIPFGPVPSAGRQRLIIGEAGSDTTRELQVLAVYTRTPAAELQFYCF